MVFLSYEAAHGHESNIQKDSIVLRQRLQGIQMYKASGVTILLLSLSTLAHNAALPRKRLIARPSGKATRAAVEMKDFSSRPITEADVQVSFSCSGGAGGQNVNKVATKADMRFNVWDAEFLPEEVRMHLLDSQANSINKDGELVVTAQTQRTQLANRNAALRKLQLMIDASTKAVTPKEANVEKIKKIKASKKKSNEKRLDFKKKNSDKKKSRGKVRDY